MRTILFIFFLLSYITTAAQQQEIDSLQRELKNHPQEDTARAHILNDLVYGYYQLDPAKGLELSQEAIRLAHKLNDSLRLTQAYLNQGLNFFAKSDFPDAFASYSRAETFVNKNEYSQLFPVHNSMATAYMKLSRYPEALKMYFDNLSLAEKLHKMPGMAICLGNIAIIYRNLKNNQKALQYGLRNLSILRELGKIRLLRTVCQISVIPIVILTGGIVLYCVI